MISEQISSKKNVAADQNIKERDYWLNQLSGELDKRFFPYDYKKTGTGERGLKIVKFTLSSEICSRLLQMSNHSHHRLHVILAAAWIVLSGKYTENKEILIGTPIYKQDIQGEFINTVLTLRNKLHPDMTFKELVLQVKQTVVEAVENQNYPIEALLYKLNLSSSGTDFPLFDSLALLKNIQDKSYLRHIPYNLLISFEKVNEHIQGEVEYNASLYEAATIERMVAHLEKLFQEVLFNPDLKLTDIDIIPEKEKNQLLFQFNNTRADYPGDKTLHGLFEEQVEKTPDRVGVMGPGAGPFHELPLNEWQLQVSYCELNERINRLAQLLRGKGVKQDRVVGIIAEPCLEMISGIIAILKAGGAYLPIDTIYPVKRILSILKDNDISHLLTREKDYDQSLLKKTVRDIIDLDTIEPVVSGYPAENLRHINQPNDLLYLISTSGSTGIPKSIMMEHRNFINLLYFEFYETGIQFRRVLQFASIGFDPSVQEIFCPLLSGGEVYLMGKEMKGDILGLFDFIRGNDIEVVFWPPAFLKYVFSEAQYYSEFPETIRHICAAGEQLMVPGTLRKYLQEHPLRLHNYYGPAETHVVTTFTLDGSGKIPEMPPIGKPISNTKIYILDEQAKIKPIGTVGELYIAGANVGRGYCQREDLTRERYINSPFVQGERLYRTGDLGRWLPDGNIEFVGRMDSQVKIRGFRVELGEIESRIMETGVVKEVLVIDIKDSNNEKYLCAYIVCPLQINIPEIKERLSNILPDYMIPSYFVRLENIPLTPHGKVDKKALPPPDIKACREYAAPRHEVEMRLVDLWHEVLGIDPRNRKIGIDDDFFELGGHSLKATILTTKVHKAFHVKLTLGEMFKLPTIRGLSGHIKKAKIEIFQSIVPVEAKTYYSLSSAQKRLYILYQLDMTSTSYNNPTSAVLEGNLDIEKFKQVVYQLTKRHEMLRTSFMVKDNQPVQYIHEQVDGVVTYREMTTDQVKSAVRRFIRPFNLSHPPLIRMEVIKTGKGTFIFMVDMHHIITDGTSIQVFIKELLALYEGKNLTPLRLQYKDFSEWQNKKSGSGEIARQGEFWLNQLKGNIPVLNLPTDYARPAVKSFEGSFAEFEINREKTQALRKLAKEENTTLYIVLLTIFNVFLCKISGQEAIAVGAPVAGRRHADLQHIIGMFVNTLVSMNYPEESKTFREFLREVNIRVLEAFENQDYPFEELVERISVSRDPSRNPLVDVVFVIQNMEARGGNIPEVEVRGLKISPYQLEPKGGTAKFDMTLVGAETGDSLVFFWEYCTRLFKEETIKRFIGYFENILSCVIKDIDQKISRLEIIPGQEKNRTDLEKRLVQLWQEVLGKERIGIDNHFFELGGNSLKAIMLTAKIHKEFDIKVSLADIFHAPTIRDFAGYMLGFARDKYLSIELAEEKEYYPLSSAQKRLYSRCQMGKESINYNMPYVLVLEGTIDRKRLQGAFIQLIHRHESFRTSFELIENEPVQRIREAVDFEIEYDDVQVTGASDRCRWEEEPLGEIPNPRSQIPNKGESCGQVLNAYGEDLATEDTENTERSFFDPESQELRAKNYIKNFIRPFDLARAPLLRVGLIRESKTKHIFMMDMHHIISDAISQDIFIRDFTNLYQGEKLPLLRLQYKDFSEWKHGSAMQKKIGKQEEYWLNQFPGGVPTIDMPTDFPRPKQLSFKGSARLYEIDEPLTAGIRDFVLESGVTLNIFFLAVYYVLLFKYTGREDMVIGTVIEGRHREDLQNIIGFFVNMLAMRNRPGKNKPFRNFLEEVKENAFKAYKNQDYQFEDLIGKLEIPGESGRYPLVDSVFVFKNETDGENLSQHLESNDNLNLIPYEFERKVSHFDLMLGILEHRTIKLIVEYSNALFKPSTIEAFIKQYVEILKQVLENPGIQLNHIMVTHDYLVAHSTILENEQDDWV